MFSDLIWQDVLVAIGILLVTAFLMYLWFWPKVRRWKKKYNAAQSGLNVRTEEYNALSKQFEQVNSQAEADKNLLSNTVNTLRSEKDSLNGQLTSLTANNQAQESKIKNLEGYKGQLDNLQVEFTAKSQLIPKLEQESIDLQSKIAGLNADLERYKVKATELTTLQKQYKDLSKDSQNAAKNAEKSSNSLQKKVGKLEAENAKLNKRYADDIAKAKEKLDAEKARAKEKFDTEKAKASQLFETEKSKASKLLDGAKGKLTEKIKVLETTVGEQKEAISSLKLIEQKYLETAPQMEQLQVKYDALLPKKASFEEDMNALQARLTQLETAKGQLTTELSSSKTVNDLLKAEIDELRLFKNQFKDGNINGQLDQLANKIKNLESHNHKVSLSLDKAEQDKKDLEKQLSILDFQKAEFDKVADEKAQFADQVDSLKTDLAYVEQTKKDLILKFEQLQQQQSDQQRNQDIVGGYRAKFNEATTKNEGLQRELTHLRTQLESKDAASTKLSANLNSLQTANDQLNQSLRKVKDDLSAAGETDGFKKLYDELSTEKEVLCANINDLENDKSQLSQKITTLEQELKGKGEATNEAKAAAEAQVNSLTNEKTQLSQKIAALEQQLNEQKEAQTQVNTNNWAEEKTQLSQKITSLEQELKGKGESTTQVSSLTKEKAQLSDRVAELEKALSEAKAATQQKATTETLKATATPTTGDSSTAGLQKQLDEVVEKLANRGLKMRGISDENELLSTENELLKAELSKLKASGATTTNSVTTSTSSANEHLSEKEKELARLREKAKAGLINFGRIGTATVDQKDNLRRIRGIGPFFEEKLNALGIYSFRQIANFTPDDAERVNDILEFFSGRIERDDWVGQAKRILKEKK